MFGEDSYVQNKEGDTVIIAQHGGNGNFGGGTGYSGGGDKNSKGGSNGSNGEGVRGGQGSGFDISDIVLKHFVLSPGDGGKPSDIYKYGCGGGGVLVDGYGPNPFGGGSGEGYGGGGDAYHSGSPGSEGVVLLEVKAK